MGARPSLRHAHVSTSKETRPAKEHELVRDQPTPRPGRFVGRRDVLSALATALGDARNGRGTIVCLKGEAGIGKTRLAEEVVEMARSASLGVHRAWGYEGDGSPPFWLWRQVLRSLTSGEDPAALCARLPDRGAGLAAVLPELSDFAKPADAHGGEEARFRVFDAVTQYVLGEARSETRVVVLDDAHWADPSSLRLLEFFAREVHQASLLMVVNTRDPSAEGNAVLGQTLGSLARHDWVNRIELTGLELPDVDALVRDVRQGAVSAGLVESVQERSRGNPFFVKELIRFLEEDPRGQAALDGSDSLALPDSIRSLVRRRLAGLSAPCLDALKRAAVLGREFALWRLARVAARAVDEVAHELEPAIDGRLVHLTSDRTLRFEHPLVQDALLLEVSSSERARLHLEVARALEGEGDATLAEVATHFAQGPLREASAKAIEYGGRAADVAMARFAFEDAILLYSQALRVVAESEDVASTTHADLLLGRSAAHSASGDVTAAREDALAAASLARAEADPARLGAAALQFATGQLVVGTRIDAVSELFEEAIALQEEDDPLRVRLLAELATFSLNPTDRARAEPLMQEALAGAHRLGNSKLLVSCLAAQLYVLWAPGNANQRIATAEQIISRPEAADVPGAIAFARNARLLSFLEKADLEAFTAGLDEFERLATERRDAKGIPFVLRYRATQAMLEGRLSEAERLSQEAFALASEQGLGELATMNMAVLTFMVRHHQGRLAEIEPLFTAMAAQYADSPGWTAALILLYTQLERDEDLRRVYESIVEDAPTLSRDPTWLSNMDCLAEACVYLADRDRAPLLYDLLAPYGSSYVVVGNGDSVVGSVSRVLGELATLLRRWNEAEAHFLYAIAQERRLGARPYLANAAHSYARMLLERMEAGDAARAGELIDEAEELAQQVGMARLLERLRALRASLGTIPSEDLSSPASVAVDPLSEPDRHGRFVDEGDYWTIGLGARRGRLKKSLGLEQLARLLQEPGREFHALDLAGQLVPPESDDVGRQLDRRSHAEYGRRLEDLRDGISEARANNDTVRESSLREEMDFIAQEISRNVGMGGRARRSGTAAERARVNVTRTIAKAIGKIRVLDPVLGRLLERTVRTGTFCVYEPDPDTPIEWRF